MQPGVWHSVEAHEALRRLASSTTGLTTAEAQRRLAATSTASVRFALYQYSGELSALEHLTRPSRFSKMPRVNSRHIQASAG